MLAKKLREKTGPDMKRMFEGTVNEWKNKPQFPMRVTNNSQKLSVMVYAFGYWAKQYALVTRGSPKHPIPKTGTTWMRYQKNYRAATKPGSLMSRRGYKYGPWVSRFAVIHPGFDPRDFDVQIAEEENKVFADDMANAIRVAIRSQRNTYHTY